eukprot:8311294-Lingulodinium_polyedra.AAC.1
MHKPDIRERARPHLSRQGLYARARAVQLDRHNSKHLNQPHKLKYSNFNLSHPIQYDSIQGNATK